ncbi:tetraprenyl-beta-curcumene synthase family protein [Salisediminibacterium beveridgei]|uniref:Tetraprenyl-beta-curcumene synthase n=1 Tax=Salisediminibacterium beveridgei TaxID=632773 RepID=A0A1D7QSW8_9BACI|nr:tetraprenyl-beta-curcumene synthase family protein [Salisediminibacterium beveridgei]AOM82104.1 hypothetical protein BBEV_0732 [Salisediminibacterium beveridgei]
MRAPKHALPLMADVYRQVIPRVHQELAIWKRKADDIPDEELRSQAQLSIRHKTFHCEGGSILGLLSGHHSKEVIRFIVAYQTISDYLDNLCDRSVSLDPNDFHHLHQAMLDVFEPEKEQSDYYACRDHTGDKNYLKDLVTVCREELVALPSFQIIQPHLQDLAKRYTELQVHKHVTPGEREERLIGWFESTAGPLRDEMSWYEYAASSGSTLGIFSLVAYAAKDPRMTRSKAKRVYEGYFPWVQGLHILMDYFIDQKEDHEEGDLNFCTYYESDEEMLRRIGYFFKRAKRAIRSLPDHRFHRMITSGLLAIYLADEKVSQHPLLRRQQFALFRFGGLESMFFYMNGRIFRRSGQKTD